MRYNMINSELQKTIATLQQKHSTLTEGRKKLLADLSNYIKEKNNKAKLNFICTHNSRRSHISMLWAYAAAVHYKMPDIEVFSGGTEATAFNPRAVAAMKRAGFIITTKNPESNNPVYLAQVSNDDTGIGIFSKKYTDQPNPSQGYAAIMTCSDADEKCPVVFGCEKRLKLTYDDPKEFDDTGLEQQKYDERVIEIGSEIFYAFDLAKTTT